MLHGRPPGTPSPCGCPPRRMGQRVHMQEVQPHWATGKGLRKVGSIQLVGQLSHFSLCQGLASHAVREENIATPRTFAGGPQDWHLEAAMEYPVLCRCPDSKQLGSVPIQLHPSFEKLACFLADRSTARKGVSIFVCRSNSDLQRRLIICVWVAKPLLAAAAAAAAAWGLLASGKTSSAAGPALGWDLWAVGIWPGPAEGLRGSQDRSRDARENCTVKNLWKEQLVDAQTGSWPRHPS